MTQEKIKEEDFGVYEPTWKKSWHPGVNRGDLGSWKNKGMFYGGTKLSEGRGVGVLLLPHTLCTSLIMLQYCVDYCVTYHKYE